MGVSSRHSLLFFFLVYFFFFNDTATTEIYTLSLHDALPIYCCGYLAGEEYRQQSGDDCNPRSEEHTSELQSHSFISYAVFCLKKTKQTNPQKLVHTQRRGTTRLHNEPRG